MTHPPLTCHWIVHQTEAGEIDLQLVTRFAISDAHRRALPTAGTEFGGDETLNRALRHDHPITGEELADLHPATPAVTHSAILSRRAHSVAHASP